MTQNLLFTSKSQHLVIQDLQIVRIQVGQLMERIVHRLQTLLTLLMVLRERIVQGLQIVRILVTQLILATLAPLRIIQGLQIILPPRKITQILRTRLPLRIIQQRPITTQR